MAVQNINARLPDDLKLFGNILLFLSLVAAVVFFYFAGAATIVGRYDDWAENGFSSVLVGLSIGAIIQGIALKLIFAFFAEVLIRLNPAAHSKTIEEVAEPASESIDEALGIAD